jgi:hypothetical protein
MVDHRMMAGEADLAGDPQSLRNADAALEVHAGIGLDGGDAIEMFQEVEMPEGAAELAIRHRLQADLLLALDQGPDLAILDLLQGLIRDFAIMMLVARLLQGGGPEQAADHIGAERRFGALHGYSSR